MAWVEAHQCLANHPKLFHLMDITDLPRDRCIGRLFLLWTWALEFAGDIRAHSALIAGACRAGNE